MIARRRLVFGGATVLLLAWILGSTISDGRGHRFVDVREVGIVNDLGHTVVVQLCEDGSCKKTVGGSGVLETGSNLRQNVDPYTHVSFRVTASSDGVPSSRCVALDVVPPITASYSSRACPHAERSVH